MTDERIEFIAKTREKLDLLNAKILDLESKAYEKKGAAQQELKSTLNDIRKSRDKAEKRLQELRLASKPAWEDVKHGVEEAWKSVASAVDSASQRFH